MDAFEGVPDILDMKDFRMRGMEEEKSVKFDPIVSKKFISLDSLESEVSGVAEFQAWNTHVPLTPSLLLQGKVVKGFGRGSKQLGVPTANLEMSDENKEKTMQLVPGVYAAMATLKRVGEDGTERSDMYKCAMSIGWNPVFDNEEKTIEAFLVHDFEGEEFYGADLELDVKSFVRAESLFSDFDSLILAIQCDIQSVVNHFDKVEGASGSD